jgi:hypothetical protein
MTSFKNEMLYNHVKNRAMILHFECVSVSGRGRPIKIIEKIFHNFTTLIETCERSLGRDPVPAKTVKQK